MSWVPPPPPPSNHYLIKTVGPVVPNILSVNDNHGKRIMDIECDGTVTWYQKGKAPEAAQYFANAIQTSVEIKAGIKQGRKEWEDRMLEAMKKRAEIEPLTPEVLTDVFRKCIMIDKLKGIK